MECDLLTPNYPVLQEIERIRQKSTHEGVHRDDPIYRKNIKKAIKDFMPLTVSMFSE